MKKIRWRIKGGGEMRKYALLKEHVSNICEVMIFSSTHETYVFLYDTLKDTACFADFSFEGLKKQKSISKNLELLGLKIKIDVI